MLELPPQIISAIVAALVSIIIFLGKEAIDRRRTSRLSNLTLLWLAKTLKNNLIRNPDNASHISMKVIEPHISTIIQNQQISEVFDDIETLIISWKQGAYFGKVEANPLCQEAITCLEIHIDFLTKMIKNNNLLTHVVCQRLNFSKQRVLR